LLSAHHYLPDLETARPADPGQGVDERAAFDAERATDRGFGGAAVERRDHRRKLFAIDRGGTPTPPTRRRAAARPALTRSWVSDRSNCARHRNMEQELALRRGGVHLLGERTECDPAFLEVVDRGQQVR
jgi:hypothetical protein